MRSTACEGRRGRPSASIAPPVLAICAIALLIAMAIGAIGREHPVPDGRALREASPADRATEAPAMVAGGLAGLSVPDVCREDGVLEATARGGLGVRARWSVDLPLEEAGESIVREYGSRQGLSLAYDGYLDLLGRVWACVVSSDEGWAEAAIVDARLGQEPICGDADAKGACEVTVVRLGRGPASEGARDGA